MTLPAITYTRPMRLPWLQIALALAIQKDGEQIVGQHPLDDLRHIGQQLVQIQRERDGGRNFQQKIEQFAPLLETDRGFAGA